MHDGREALKKILENLPKWTDTTKRTERSLSGNLLGAIADENDSILKELDEYIKTFFLKTYYGKEDKEINLVKVAQVGEITPPCKLLNTTVKLTSDPKKFTKEPKKYALYQNGFILIIPEMISDDELKYHCNDYQTSAKLETKQLWNIFDEFAKMTSLERFPGEKNSELAKRCFSAFRNRTNSTVEGIKNTIINVIENYETISPDNITIEMPNGENMYLPIGDSIVYNVMSEINKDTLATKEWDTTLWENDFKGISYIPNKWDEKLSHAQNGVGQMDDLKVSIAGNLKDADTTDVKIMAYKKSRVKIDDYIRRQGLKKHIPLRLKKYKNQLKINKATYKIVAAPAEKIDIEKIMLKSYRVINGTSTHYIDELLLNSMAATLTHDNELKKNSSYRITFEKKDEYTPIEVYKADVINNDYKATPITLPSNDSFYVDKTGTIRSKKDATYIKSVKLLKNNINLADKNNGFSLGEKANKGSAYFSIKNAHGKNIQITTETELTDYTTENAHVTSKGMTLANAKTWTAQEEEDNATLEIDIVCRELYYEFAKEANARRQGSMTVEFKEDEVLNKSMSGIWSEPKIVHMRYEKPTHVRIKMVKFGIEPFSIKNIKAAKYHYTLHIGENELVADNGTYHIPYSPTDENVRFEMVSDSTYPPVIKCIQIGEPNNEPLTLLIPNEAQKRTLSINAQAKMKLEEIKSGAVISTVEDFTTHGTLYNNTDSKVYIPIDTKMFNKIIASDKTIHKIEYQGKEVGAISLEPQEKIRTIKIQGEATILNSIIPLSRLIHLKPTEKAYVAYQSKGILIKDDDGSQRKEVINKEDLVRLGETFEWVGYGEKIIPCFVINKTNKIEAYVQKFSEEFEHVYLTKTDSQQSTAYNKKNVVGKSAKVSMDMTFYPTISPNTIYYYEIIPTIQDNGEAVDVMFEVQENRQSWSLGFENMIHIEYPKSTIDSGKFYETSEVTVAESFILSNEIPLSDTYSIGSENLRLIDCEIEVPKEMKIRYEERKVKLKLELNDTSIFYIGPRVRSITSINSIGTEEELKIPYQLFENNNIIYFAKEDLDKLKLTSRQIYINYVIDYPTKLVFRDIDSLYQLVEYSIDAYESMNSTPIVFVNMRHGESKPVIIDGQKPDKITVRCSNPSFAVNIKDNLITANKVGTNKTLMVHTGYYYDNEEECYLFENLHKETARSNNDIQFNNVQQLGDMLLCSQKMDNHVRGTSITSGGQEVSLCHLNPVLTPEYVKGISNMTTVTACESYQLWMDFDMDIELTQALNNLGIKFKPKSTAAYAMFEITRDIKDNLQISMYASKGLSIYLMKEVKINSDSLERSIFAKRATKFQRIDGTDFQECIIERYDPDYKYYILVEGEGVIDDIIIKDYDKTIPIEDIHRKNIQKLNFDVPEMEKDMKQRPFYFNSQAVETNGLDVAKDGTISTGATADWGLTRIHALQNQLKDFNTELVKFKHNAFYSEGRTGFIESPLLPIPNKKSAAKIFIKINDIIKSPFQYFNVIVETCDYIGAPVRRVYASQKTNLIEIDATNLSNYIKFMVEMEPNKVINNIEVYSMYIEDPMNALQIFRNESGNLISQVFNMVTPVNARPIALDGTVCNEEAITLFIRGKRVVDEKEVWTQWYPYTINEDLSVSGMHVFNNYQFFQAKIAIKSEESEIKIKRIIFEVL